VLRWIGEQPGPSLRGNPVALTQSLTARREAASIRITALGVYEVKEAPDPCHLVELRLEPDRPGETLDLRAITQGAEGAPGDAWQTPSEEHVLTTAGDAGHPLDLDDAVAVRPPARVAFFFHFLRLDRPLLTPAGPVTLPAASPRPPRLSFIVYI
jgi:hypothetical protein